MRIARFGLFMLLSAGPFLVQPSSVFAAQRPADMVSYAGEMDRFLSPNELQLAELQRERQDLLQSRENEKNARLLKNKITILNNKIAYLQRQIKLTRPYMVTQRLVPLKVKGAADEAEHLPASPAWTPNAAQPKPAAQAAQRLEPSQAAAPAPAPVKISPLNLETRTFSSPDAREDAQTAVLPRRLDVKPVMAIAPRENASTQTLPIRVDPRPFGTTASREAAAAQTLPIRMEWRTFAPVSERLAAAPQAIVAKPAAPAPAAPTDHKGKGVKTGADWKKMALADKEIYILSVMGNLSRRDVYLMKPYSYYIQTIDQAIEKNPLLEQEFVHRILMMTAYDSEPDSRKDLEKVWK